MIKRIIPLILLLSHFLTNAQENQFSQFFSSAIFVNPAFAGFENTNTVKINYKKSDEAQDGSLLQLSQFTFIKPLLKTTTATEQIAGLGVTFSDERFGFKGIYQSSKIILTGAYVLQFDPKGLKRLSFGIQTGVMQRRLNPENIQVGSQYNPYIGYDNTLPSEFQDNGPSYYPIVNSGIVFSKTDHQNPLLQRNSFMIGISADYLNRPKTGEVNSVPLPVTYKGITTLRIKIGPKLFIHPSSLVLKRSNQYQVNNGLYLSRYIDSQLSTLIQLGIWHRVNDSFIGLMGVRYKGLQIGLSVDLNSATFNSNEVIYFDSGRQSFELSLSFNFAQKNSIVRINNPLF